jgi:hypothetical protein
LSPNARIEAIEMFLAFACYKKFKFYQMDVKTAFLNGDLEEEVYVEKPKFFQLNDKKDYSCKLRKDLYGIKQALRAWYYRLDRYLHQQGFKKGTVDNNLYIKAEGNDLLIILVYVDDIIFGSNIELMSKKFVVEMQQEFEMFMSAELSFFLGLQIHQLERGIFISQSKYLKELLKKFGMENYTPVRTPMTTSCKLSKDDDAPNIDQTMYNSMIGNLLYLTISRPNIMQVVGLFCRFQSNPKENHVLAVKRILRYLQGTIDYVLWYPKDTNLILRAYTDVDLVGSLDDRKITSGGALFLSSCLVSCLNKKQTSISLSTA